MKRTPQTVEKVGRQLDEALAGVEAYLRDWFNAPQDFTTEVELQMFAAKLREMRMSLDTDEIVPILGLWRIMETWPFKSELRQKIVEAELAYERVSANR
jgi:hypothetical protein